jgi:protein-disulfide isomerase
MRVPLALAAIVLTTAAAPQPAKDWRTTATVSPAGSVLVGNPAAKVKLVEYLSFTCSHCAEFAKESHAPLHDSLVKRGLVRVETRAAVRDGFDMAAWSIARCAPATRFSALSADIFAQQAAWGEQGNAWVQANGEKIKPLPFPKQLRAFADGAGLTAIGARHGLTAAAFDACLANPALGKQLDAMTQAAFAKIPGTPGFEVNGVLAKGVGHWADLQPLLAAAGAR